MAQKLDDMAHPAFVVGVRYGKFIKFFTSVASGATKSKNEAKTVGTMS